MHSLAFANARDENKRTIFKDIRYPQLCGDGNWRSLWTVRLLQILPGHFFSPRKNWTGNAYIAQREGGAVEEVGSYVTPLQFLQSQQLVFRRELMALTKLSLNKSQTNIDTYVL